LAVYIAGFGILRIRSKKREKAAFPAAFSLFRQPNVLRPSPIRARCLNRRFYNLRIRLAYKDGRLCHTHGRLELLCFQQNRMLSDP
jgi:hypothetical protein